jgi:hypothetical protein
MVAAILILSGIVGSAVAQDEPPAPEACSEGIFLVDGAPLLPAPTAIAQDAVILHDGQVSIASGCPAVEAHIRATPFGTIVRASWRRCGEVAKGVRLLARIGRGCRRMVGRLYVVEPPIKRRFVAAQCNDPASCRDFCRSNDQCEDGEYCAKRAGHCDGRGVCRQRPAACPDVYEPVCGCDGITYSNRCDAAAAGVNVKHRGRCPVSCDPADPNACEDGEFCHLPPGVCESTDVKGTCVDKPDACPDVFDPVCGCDGRTYGNRCEAAAAGVNVRHHGRCPVACDPAAPDACGERQFCELPPGVCDRADVRGTCVEVPNGCPDVYEPVCGCDGVTYSNDCDRRAAGVSKAHDGPCAECRDACDCYPRPFPEPCAALCPTCDNWWTCQHGQCVAVCGPEPADSCDRLCAGNEHCRDAEFCHKRPGHCEARGVCDERPRECTEEFQPVCGCDGETYPNRCHAFAAGTSIAHAGPCRQRCGTILGIPCPDGQYCELPPGMCDGADLGGMCFDLPDVCPLVVEPVCGCDGKTYVNDCERMRAQVQLAHRGRCENTASVR